MMHEFCKYNDETLVVFTDIVKNEEGEEVVYVHFERPKEYGFDSVRFELPSCKILHKEGKYTDKEIEIFKSVVEKGKEDFFQWAREGGLNIA